MPRLVNIGVGEIADRLTILSLKILYGRQQGKLIDHFETERNALLTQLRSRELNGAWFEQVLGLGAVNAALWQAEDVLRQLRQDYEARASGVDCAAREVAFRIQELNDQRAGLIETINKLTGDHLGSEKL
jgi:hypothetical protein